MILYESFFLTGSLAFLKSSKRRMLFSILFPFFSVTRRMPNMPQLLLKVKENNLNKRKWKWGAWTNILLRSNKIWIVNICKREALSYKKLTLWYVLFTVGSVYLLLTLRRNINWDRPRNSRRGETVSPEACPRRATLTGVATLRCSRK
jgi:hypothetical protein